MAASSAAQRDLIYNLSFPFATSDDRHDVNEHHISPMFTHIIRTVYEL